jgi:hypothetical protein
MLKEIMGLMNGLSKDELIRLKEECQRLLDLKAEAHRLKCELWPSKFKMTDVIR